MAGRKSDFTLPTLDDLFSSQEEREEQKLAKIRDIPLELIDPFPDHPFKVRDDEDILQRDERLNVQQKNLMDSLLISDGIYLSQEKAVDYASQTTFVLSQMTEAGQRHWEWAQKQGYAAQRYSDLYAAYSQAQRKEDKISALKAQGLSQLEAERFYKEMTAKK